MAGNVLIQVMTERGLVNGTGQTEMTEVTGSCIDRLLVRAQLKIKLTMEMMSARCPEQRGEEFIHTEPEAPK
jgi:hypothetical protein